MPQPQLFVEGTNDPFVQPLSQLEEAVASCCHARIAWIGCATHAIHAIHVIQAIRIARSTARPACTLWTTRTSRQPRAQHRIHVTDMHSSGRRRRESSDHHRAQSSESSGHSLIVQPRNDIDCCCISGAGLPACWHTVSLSRWSSR